MDIWSISGNVADAVVVSNVCGSSKICVTFLIRAIYQTVVLCPVSVLYEFCCCRRVLNLWVVFVWKTNYALRFTFASWLLFNFYFGFCFLLPSPLAHLSCIAVYTLIAPGMTCDPNDKNQSRTWIVAAYIFIYFFCFTFICFYKFNMLSSLFLALLNFCYCFLISHLYIEACLRSHSTEMVT